MELKSKPIGRINVNDDRFANLLDEVKSCLNDDDDQEVFFFDHHVAGESHPIQTRTAVMNWDPEQFLIIQSHYWGNGESDPVTIRLPVSSIKFMISDFLERSIYAAGYKISPNSVKELRFAGWVEKESIN